MTTTSEAAAGRTAVSKASPFIDCDIHNYIASDEVLLSYLEPRWRDHHREYGNRGYQAVAFPGAPYPRSAGGGKRYDAHPPSGLPVGADYDFFRAQHLDAHPILYGLLNCISPVGEQLDPDYDAALARAMNDWQIAEWLKDPRLVGSILIPYESPQDAADEINRLGEHPNLVQVLLRPRTREPLGRRRYWPIYEAAERHRLPIALHFGGISGVPITSGGWPSFYIEDHTTMSQAFQSQIITMVCDGMFDRFPNLRVLLTEGGIAAVPPLMWRMDKHWRRLRSEVPHLTRRPSEIIREHIRITTQPMEEPHKPHQLLEILEHLESDRMVLFATDYPHWDYDNPERAFPVKLPVDLKRRIMVDNALELYGLSYREVR